MPGFSTKRKTRTGFSFFDEADALFGKRTGIRDAHDKYANQEVSYLSAHRNVPGIDNFSFNFKSNIDDAFLRRFKPMIFSRYQSRRERQALWEKAFPSNIKLDPKIEWANLSRQFELTGASIMNIVQYCCITALEQGETQFHSKIC
ncbi:MAG: hypothetical protein IPM82_28520 [Saprospiraceae bacterium]|nr:hypothetical protein [Saprospiraceae bacterium]